MFRVGDTVSGWSTGKKVVITAIGETRFLAWDENKHRRSECVCTMRMDWKMIKKGKE